jgi:hypothetical protein
MTLFIMYKVTTELYCDTSEIYNEFYVLRFSILMETIKCNKKYANITTVTQLNKYHY